MRRSCIHARLLITLIILGGCSPDPTIPSASLTGARMNAQLSRGAILVTSIDALYQAVNNPANAGRSIVIAPNTYYLDAAYGKGGRLELQPNMTLRGATGNANDVIMDASHLTQPNFTDSTQLVNGVPLFTGAIRAGRGVNTIDALTIRGAAAAASGIAVDLPGGSAIVRIRAVTATGNVRGVDVRNIGSAMAGRSITVELRDNHFVDNVIGAGQGVRFVNTQGATRARIVAKSTNNEYARNAVGTVAANLNTDSATILIRSIGDKFVSNGNGYALLAGNSGGANYARNNELDFVASDARFEGNGAAGTPPSIEPFGISAIGGLSQQAGRASNNKLTIDLRGTAFLQNQPVDVSAFGAQTAAPAPAGTGNSVRIRLRGVSAMASVDTTASAPVDPTNSNTVKVVRQ